MKTPPPDKQPAGETLEEIAARVLRPYYGTWSNEFTRGLERDILSALRNERERAVRIIDEHQALDKCEDNCWTTIKKAIREGSGVY